MSTESAGAVREETVKSGDRGIFVRSWSPSGGGKPRAIVVLVHGFNSHGGYYIRTGEALAARGFATYALDLRGRGRSDGDRFYIESMSEYVQDVATVVSLAKLRHPGLPTVLLGHSAGGVVSCIYTLEHQHELAGFICESFAFQAPFARGQRWL